MTKAATEIIPAQESLSVDGLLARAIDKGVDIGTLERLLALRASLKAEAAKEAYFAALGRFQGKCPTIPKTKRVKYRTRSGDVVEYSFAPLEIIVETIKGILQEEGLSFRFSTPTAGGVLTATCIVQHVQGHSEESPFSVPINTGGKMSAPQEAGSASTYAKRYALCNALGILTGDEDDDAVPEAPANGAAKEEPKKAEPAKKDDEPWDRKKFDEDMERFKGILGPKSYHEWIAFFGYESKSDIKNPDEASKVWTKIKRAVEKKQAATDGAS